MSAETLRFADALELGSDYPSTLVEVADELRRLHAVEQERDRLREALAMALEVLAQSENALGLTAEETTYPGTIYGAITDCATAINAARAALGQKA